MQVSDTAWLPASACFPKHNKNPIKIWPQWDSCRLTWQQRRHRLGRLWNKANIPVDRGIAHRDSDLTLWSMQFGFGHQCQIFQQPTDFLNCFHNCKSSFPPILCLIQNIEEKQKSVQNWSRVRCCTLSAVSRFTLERSREWIIGCLIQPFYKLDWYQRDRKKPRVVKMISGKRWWKMRQNKFSVAAMINLYIVGAQTLWRLAASGVWERISGRWESDRAIIL